MSLRSTVLVVVAMWHMVGLVCADQGGVIATMDELRFQPPKEKGTLKIVTGKTGKATRFHFDQDCRSIFFTSNIHGTASGIGPKASRSG